MVVNLVYSHNEVNKFICIDGNGVIVLDGRFSTTEDIDRDEIIWRANFYSGICCHAIERTLSWFEYYSYKEKYDEQFLRELIAEEESFYVNKVIAL